MSIKTYREQLEAQVAAARKTARRSNALGLMAAAPSAPGAEEMLRVLADDAAPAKERLGALAGLKVLAFASPDARQMRPRFIESMRSAVKDPGVRLAALSTLTELGDPTTRQQLVEGLRDPGKALVPKARAFELLANDQHADAVDSARQTVDDADDAESVAAALPLLARDPASVDRLHRIVIDRRAPDHHRRTAAESLFALDKAALKNAKVSGDADLKAFVRGLLEPAAGAAPSKPSKGAKSKPGVKNAPPKKGALKAAAKKASSKKTSSKKTAAKKTAKTEPAKRKPTKAPKATEAQPRSTAKAKRGAKSTRAKKMARAKKSRGL